MANYSVGGTHDLKIGTAFVRIVPGTYNKTPRPDIAPRLSIGPASEADETIFLHTTQRDWRGGIGAIEFESADKFWDSEKVWIPDMLLNPHLRSVAKLKISNQVGGGLIKKFVVAVDDYFWIAVDSSVYKVLKTAGNWVIQTPSLKTFSGPLWDMAAGAGGGDSNLWVSCSAGADAGIWKMDYATGTWTLMSSWIPSTMATPFLDKMWLGGQQSVIDEKNKLYSYSGGASGDFVGRVGPYGWRINGLAIAMNRLWIGKEEGTYVYDGVSISPWFVKQELRGEYNCRRMAYFDGYIYFGMRTQLFRTSGGATERIPYTFDDPIYGITTTEFGVLVSTKGTTDRLYYVSRAGIVKLLTATPIGEIYGTLSDAGQCTIRWFDFGIGCEANSYYVGSKEHGGFPNRDKNWLLARVVHSALDSAKGHAVRILYSTDDTETVPTFTELGVSNTNGAKEKILYFPAGTKSKILILKVQLEATNTDSAGPKLIETSLGYLLCPVNQRMWGFVIDCTEEIQLLNGEVEKQKGASLAAYIWGLADSGNQISFTDLDGSVKTVIVEAERQWGEVSAANRERKVLRTRVIETGG